jgi:hypothetical protein
MPARVSKQGRTKRAPARKGKRLRAFAVIGPFEFSEAAALEEPRRTAVSVYAEETEIKDYEEERAA